MATLFYMTLKQNKTHKAKPQSDYSALEAGMGRNGNICISWFKNTLGKGMGFFGNETLV